MSLAEYDLIKKFQEQGVLSAPGSITVKDLRRGNDRQVVVPNLNTFISLKSSPDLDLRAFLYTTGETAEGFLALGIVPESTTDEEQPFLARLRISPFWREGNIGFTSLAVGKFGKLSPKANIYLPQSPFPIDLNDPSHINLMETTIMRAYTLDCLKAYRSFSRRPQYEAASESDVDRIAGAIIDRDSRIQV